MSQANSAVFLPSLMEQKLSQIGQRQVVIAILRAITVGVSVFIVAMVVAMLIDWQFTLFNTGLRLGLSIGATLLAVGSSLIVGIPPLLAALKRVRAATSADAGIPQLEERWQTVVSLVESGRRPTSPAAIAMLQQVTSEAVAIGRLVQPQRVADQTSLKTALKSFALCAVALIGFLATDWRQTSVLLRRFLAPMSNISATSLRCTSGDFTVARGEFVKLETETTGLQRPFAILSIVRPGARPELIEVAADAKQANRFAHRIQADDSFQYQVRAGDGQTTWHQVSVVDYPSFAEVRITVISPAYLNRPDVEKSIFPARLKVPQGSLMKLELLPRGPLERLELTVSPESDSKDKATAQPAIHQLAADADGWYRYQIQLMENVSLAPHLLNAHGLTNEDRNVCRVQVIADNAPVARVLNSTEEMSVANDDVVDIKFEAHDDHGIAKAELVIYDESTKEEGKPAEILKVIPIPLGDKQLDKHVIATTQLDLKQLNLKPGAQISYAIRVTDNRSASHEAPNGQETTGDQENDPRDAASTTASTDPRPTATGEKTAEANDRQSPTKRAKNTTAASPGSESAQDSEVAEQTSDESPDGPEGENPKASPKASSKPAKKASTAASPGSESAQDSDVAEQMSDESQDAPGGENPKASPKASSKPAKKASTASSPSSESAQDSEVAEQMSDESPDAPGGESPKASPKASSKPAKKASTAASPSSESEQDSEAAEQTSDESPDAPGGENQKTSPKASSKPAKKASTAASPTSESAQDSEVAEQTYDESPDATGGENQKTSPKASSKPAKKALTAEPNATEESQSTDSTEMAQGEGEKEQIDRGQQKKAKSKTNGKSSKPSDQTKKEGESEDRSVDSDPVDPATGEAADENAASTPRNENDEKDPMPGDSANDDAKTSEGGDQQPAPSERSEKERTKSKRQTAQGDDDRAPPPAKMMAMDPQASTDGQDAETKRNRLKITARLSAIAESRETRKVETGKIRDRVVEIDAMLSDVEIGLTRAVNREIPDDDRSAQFKLLDTQLGSVEGKISTLRKQTRDSQYAFMGLQMVDIGRSHISPARERVFTAIREPAIGSDGNSRGALQQIVRARELLAALLVRYDKVAQDQKLADSLEQGIKIYEIYVEKMQALLREAQQGQNPLERKMAVLEIGQDYLDRYAEVLTMRRDMMDEFGRILGDDPRLLARYLDLVKRRRTSLRNQLSELSKRQHETATELNGWVASDEVQRQDLWTVAVELRMQASTQLAKDAAELAERIEKQFPLVLEATQRTQASVIELGRQIAETSRAISLEAKRQIRQPDVLIDLRPKGRQLVQLFVDLDAMLERLSFENSSLLEVTNYVTSRLLESRTVADQAELWSQTAEFIHARQFHRMAEVDQHRLTISTELLRMDMLGIETELSAQFQQLAEKSVPDDIAKLIRELQQLMVEITFDQASATFQMSADQLPTADRLLKEATDSFSKAEELFDRIRVATAAALDELAPRNPNVADLQDPKLDEFLTQLEREPNIEAQLGLGERPNNLRVIADTMQWQETGGRMLSDSEEAARGRTEKEMDQQAQGAKPEAKPEKPEAELSEKEREKREQAREMEAKLTKALAEMKERAKDPATDPAEREQLEQMQEKLQEKLDELAQESDAGNLAEKMEEDLMKTLAAIKEESSELPKGSVDTAKMDQLTKDLVRIVEQVGNEPNSEARWKMSTEFERKKQVLKALARGQHIPDEQWNKLLSALDDGLWQIGGRTLPEEYRKAIEQYQEQIRRLTNDSNEKRR